MLLELGVVLNLNEKSTFTKINFLCLLLAVLVGMLQYFTNNSSMPPPMSVSLSVYLAVYLPTNLSLLWPKHQRHAKSEVAPFMPKTNNRN